MFHNLTCSVKYFNSKVIQMRRPQRGSPSTLTHGFSRIFFFPKKKTVGGGLKDGHINIFFFHHYIYSINGTLLLLNMGMESFLWFGKKRSQR